MTSELSEADLDRLSRQGIAPLTDAEGTELFDRALAAAHPAPLALRTEPAALRSQARAGLLPPLLSGLVRTSQRRQSAKGSLAAKLASLPPAEREPYALELVRSEVAAVLGHGSPGEVDPQRAFKEMGFDSLAAVELRNRLNAISGLRLAATTVFDYPTPEALASHLLEQAGELSANEGVRTGVDAELDRIEAILADLDSTERKSQAVERLRGLLVRFDSEPESDLAEATDEEMFELLDQKLGRV